MPLDVLEHGHWGAKGRDGVADVGPEVSLVLLPHASASLTERLTRVPARDDVNARHGRPVHAGDVAQVGGVRVAVGEHLARALVDVGHPYGAGAEHLFGSAVEPAHA